MPLENKLFYTGKTIERRFDDKQLILKGNKRYYRDTQDYKLQDSTLLKDSKLPAQANIHTTEEETALTVCDSNSETLSVKYHNTDSPTHKRSRQGTETSRPAAVTSKDRGPDDTNHKGISHRRMSARHETSEHIKYNDEDSEGEDAADMAKAQDEMIEQMEKARRILGKYKTRELQRTHPTVTESWLCHTIRGIIQPAGRAMTQHRFKFHNTRDTAKYNTKILKRYKYDLVKAFKKEQGTMLEPGSEFRTHTSLEPLLSNHKNWRKMQQIISKGITYTLEDLPEDERKRDVASMVMRGNHPSASDQANEATLLKNYEKEVRNGWMLPVTAECVTKIQDAGVIPIGIATQMTIDEKGNRLTKRRTIHDASFPPPSGMSINRRLLPESLEPCFYGFCLLRILHFIHMLRFTHPDVAILIMKLDLDAAYRRLHVLIKMAALSITIIQRIAYILLRLPFGVANGPGDYSTISETIFDMTNDILRDDTWDHKTLHSPLQAELDKPKRENTNIPFGKARRLFVPVPYHPASADGYIDDIISVALAASDWVARAQNAALLAIHTVFRPRDPRDPLPREDTTSIRKLRGEGTPDERKIVLGWLVDTRKFRVYLPRPKALDWLQQIDEITKAGKTNTKTLESMIGKLNHIGYIMPQGRYFLNRLRHLLKKTKKYGQQTLDTSSKNDFLLWQTFINTVSSKGIDINNITFSEPTSVCFSDACEHGMGGYNENGLAWRFEIPQEHIGKFSINLLEFIAAVITIELTLNHGKNNQKILAFTDSSSALGWLFKASFPTSMPHHDTTARYLAASLIRRDSSLYSQHVPGKHNIIADSLSRDLHIPPLTLTNILCRTLPTQIPPNFRIISPPKATISWMLSLLRSEIKSPEPPRAPTRSRLGVLTSGRDFWKQWGLATSGSMDSTNNKEHTSCAHLQPLVDEINAAKQARNNLRVTRSRPPSHMFVRPSGQTFGPTPPSTPTINHPSSCRDS